MTRTRLRIRPEELRRLRLKAVLTRRQLADLSGISRRRIDELEVDGRDEGVHPDTARKLAAALNVSVSRLVEVNGERQAS